MFVKGDGMDVIVRGKGKKTLGLEVTNKVLFLPKAALTT
jgi:hypothetical protein